MPTITAQSIIDKAQTILQDTTEVRWTEAELLGWLNDGQREIAMRRPDAYSKIANVTLAAGTKQSIPSDGTAILKVIRNMGANGTTPGRAIRHVPADVLDSNVPNWHAATQVAEILHAVVDVRMPKFFYVYPPANGTTQVEVLYAAPPADVTNKANAISVDDVFATPLVDYLCFRAYSKDQDLTGNVERARAHYELFLSSLNGKAQADSVVRTGADNVKG
jgi:hypothetical protein